MTIEDILNAVKRQDCSLVEVTGGEPLLQEETVLLIQELLAHGFRVLVETNGSLDAGSLPEDAVRIIDIKCPGSGESGTIFRGNLENLRPTDEFKFVITSRADYDWAVKIARDYHLDERATVLFSCARGRLGARRLAEWIISDGIPVRLNLQLHKVIWGSQKRGV